MRILLKNHRLSKSIYTYKIENVDYSRFIMSIHLCNIESQIKIHENKNSNKKNN